MVLDIMTVIMPFRQFSADPSVIYTITSWYLADLSKVQDKQERKPFLKDRGPGMAPVEVIDYLVVHELVHIGQPDHSRLFWTKVKSILPDYKKRGKWLKQNGRLLTL